MNFVDGLHFAKIVSVMNIDYAIDIIYRIAQNFGGGNFWQMKLENAFGWWRLGCLGISLVIQDGILEGKFLTVAGESAKSAKIFPQLNFALYGKLLNRCRKQINTVFKLFVKNCQPKNTTYMVYR